MAISQGEEKRFRFAVHAAFRRAAAAWGKCPAVTAERCESP
jgi:hypothetical protein